MIRQGRGSVCGDAISLLTYGSYSWESRRPHQGGFSTKETQGFTGLFEMHLSLRSQLFVKTIFSNRSAGSVAISSICAEPPSTG
jgi:hypothetical protein